MLEHCPTTVQSRGRCYLSERQREQFLDESVRTANPYGRGVRVSVTAFVVDHRDNGATVLTGVKFRTQVGYYGSIRLPTWVRDELSLRIGDHCRLTVLAVDKNKRSDDLVRSTPSRSADTVRS